MNHEHFYGLWPEAKNHFLGQYSVGRLPSDEEIQLKLADLEFMGAEAEAEKIRIWWSAVPHSFKGVAVKSERPGLYFAAPKKQALSESPSTEDEIFAQLAAQQAAPPPVREPEKSSPLLWLVPVSVIILVVGLFFSGSVISVFKAAERGEFSTQEYDGKSRLDRFDNGPTYVDPKDSPYARGNTFENQVLGSSPYFENVFAYTVNPDLSLTPEPKGPAKDAWENTLRVFGEDAKRLKKFQVAFDDYDVGGGELTAYVDFQRDSLTISVNEELRVPSTQAYILTHEYNHVLTVLGQFEPMPTQCSTVVLLAGSICLDEDSLLNEWVKEFWSDPKELEDVSTADMSAGVERYRGNPEDYVSLYAASAPQEDMAESFAVWVFGGELPKDKRSFFESRPDQVKLKERIVQSLTAE